MIKSESPFLQARPVSDRYSIDLGNKYPGVTFDRFLLRPPPYDLSVEQPVGKLLRNRVLIERKIMDNAWTPGGGIVVPDVFQKGTSIFRVLAVGPGAWFKVGKKRVWIAPDVSPGDIVESRHWYQASEHPDWIQPVYLDDQGGKGRVVLDSRFLIYKHQHSTKEE